MLAPGHFGTRYDLVLPLCFLICDKAEKTSGVWLFWSNLKLPKPPKLRVAGPKPSRSLKFFFGMPPPNGVFGGRNLCFMIVDVWFFVWDLYPIPKKKGTFCQVFRQRHDMINHPRWASVNGSEIMRQLRFKTFQRIRSMCHINWRMQDFWILISESSTVWPLKLISFSKLSVLTLFTAKWRLSQAFNDSLYSLAVQISCFFFSAEKIYSRGLPST